MRDNNIPIGFLLLNLITGFSKQLTKPVKHIKHFKYKTLFKKASEITKNPKYNRPLIRSKRWWIELATYISLSREFEVQIFTKKEA